MDPRKHVFVHVVEHHHKNADGAQSVQRGKILGILKYVEIGGLHAHSPLNRTEAGMIRKSVKPGLEHSANCAGAGLH
jgi:hypothetical protein